MAPGNPLADRGVGRAQWGFRAVPGEPAAPHPELWPRRPLRPLARSTGAPTHPRRSPPRPRGAGRFRPVRPPNHAGFTADDRTCRPGSPGRAKQVSHAQRTRARYPAQPARCAGLKGVTGQGLRFAVHHPGDKGGIQGDRLGPMAGASLPTGRAAVASEAPGAHQGTHRRLEAIGSLSLSMLMDSPGCSTGRPAMPPTAAGRGR